jgi:hypothetical protein
MEWKPSYLHLLCEEIRGDKRTLGLGEFESLLSDVLLVK